MASVKEVESQRRDLERDLNQRLRSDRPWTGPRETYAQALAQLAGLPELSSKGMELMRVLYHLSERDLVASSREPFLVRIPLHRATASRSVAGWLRLLKAKYGKKTPLAAVWPNDGRWLDLFIGGLPPDQFYCIRVPAASALATSIPYAIDPEFRIRFETVLKRALANARLRY